MTYLMRVCGVAASVLMLTICSVAVAGAEPAPQTNPSSTLPTTITLQISSGTTGGTTTTVTVEVRPGAAGQPSEVRVATDADPRTPTIMGAAFGSTSIKTVPVDAQHPFDWNLVARVPSGTSCGPHPPAGTSGCAQRSQVSPASAPAAAAPALAEQPAPELAPPPAPAAQAGASPPQPANPAAAAAPPPAAPPTPASAGANPATPLTYTVQPGDTLRAIAQRFYGDPEAFGRIAQANAGRVMPDGHTLANPHLIRAGWELLIPEPTRAIANREGTRWYTVQPGDTLVGIAARLLGDGQRWPEVYALNRATQFSGNSSLLGAGPSLIRPGMQLRLPGPTNTPSGTTSAQPEQGGVSL